MRPSAEQEKTIAAAGGGAFDWKAFVETAEHHGVLPLVARSMTRYAEGLPAEIRQSLLAAYERNLRRSLWFAAELGRVAGHLSAEGVRVLPYKGPVLAQAVYGDLGLRSFSDLDLLIAPGDFERAKQALAEIGYQPAGELLAAVERFWLRTGYERSFDGTAGKNLIELQWALLPRFYAVAVGSDFRFEDLYARAGRTRVGEVDIPCMAAEDSLLVLCLHAAKHLWTRLIWVVDIAETLRSADLDMSVAAARARRLGIARMAGVSLWLAERLLGAEVPPAARELIDGDDDVERLGECCATRLCWGEGYDLESSEYFRSILGLRERRQDRWRYAWRLATTPGQGEIEAIALPESLFALYRAVRIARLLRKLG